MLDRDPTTFVAQDRFGGSDAEPGQRGNCMQACLANVLGMPLDEIPHFYDTDQDEVQQGIEISRWCAARGWLCVYLSHEWLRCPWVVFPPDALLILSGTSPRNSAWSHVVVGHVGQDGWQLVHDPHPSGDGIAGDPTGAYLLAQLPKDCVPAAPAGDGALPLLEPGSPEMQPGYPGDAAIAKAFRVVSTRYATDDACHYAAEIVRLARQLAAEAATPAGGGVEAQAVVYFTRGLARLRTSMNVAGRGMSPESRARAEQQIAAYECAIRRLASTGSAPAPREWEATDAEIAAWVERHDLESHLRGTDARCAFEDARSAHLLSAAPTQEPQQ